MKLASKIKMTFQKKTTSKIKTTSLKIEDKPENEDNLPGPSLHNLSCACLI